jgi:hypothetical protein
MTRVRLAVCLSVCAVFAGAAAFYYGQALGALLVSECPSFKIGIATGRCAWPIRWVWAGILTFCVGLISLVCLLIATRIRRARGPTP